MRQFALAGHRPPFVAVRPAPLLAVALLLCVACAGGRGADPGTIRASTAATPLNPTPCEAWGSIAFFRNASAQEVRECLLAGADPNGLPGLYPLPPLFVAAGWTPHPAVIPVLVDAGADVTARPWGGRTPLHEAAGQNTAAGIVAALVEAGVDPNTPDWDGIAPLHLAASSNRNPDVVTELVEAGADLNARDPAGNTPLRLAWTDGTDRRPVARELLRLGADPLARNDAGEVADQTHCEHWNTRTFIQVATPEDFARCLDAGVDVNARDGRGRTPLQSAVSRLSPLTVSILLDAGVDVNAVDSLGGVPLTWAVARWRTEPETATELVLQLLAAGADPNVRVTWGGTPLIRAVESDAAALVGALLEAGADPNAPNQRGELPLDIAVQWGEAEVIRLLEAGGAETSGRALDEMVPQQEDISPEATDTLCDFRDSFSFTEAPPESLRDCLEAGARVNQSVFVGHTLLLYLATSRLRLASNSPYTVEKIVLLLGAGADANTRNVRGETPLHGTSAPAAVAALLQAGADVNPRDWRGRTPLHNAAETRDAGATTEDTVSRVHQLLRAGAEVNARANLGETPLHLAASARRGDPVPVISALLEAGAELDARTGDGRTPLHAAVQADQPAAAIALVEAGADPTARDDAGNLADPTACEHWGKAVFFAAADAGVIARCLEAGADPNPVAGTQGQTWAWLLHAAAANARDSAVITALLEAGADVHARDRFGYTPLHAAARNASAAAVRVLLETGPDLNARNRDGNYIYFRGGSTPLHIAASNPNPEVTAALIEAGANVRSRAFPLGTTPLHIAALNPNPAVAALLLEAGANVNAREFSGVAAEVAAPREEDAPLWFAGGHTPLHQAALNQNPEVLAVLLEAGADPGDSALRTDHFPHYYSLSRSVTPLHIAARSNRNPEIVAALVAAGAEVDADAGMGQLDTYWDQQPAPSPSPVGSPLYFAVRYDGNPATIEAVAHAGADLDFTDPDGRTALHVAAISNPSVFPLLLRLGADPEAVDAEGKTPMDYARENPALRPWGRVGMSTPLGRR